MSKIRINIKLMSIFIIMTMIVLSVVGTIVYATDFGSELMSISDNVGAATKGTTKNIKTDTNAWGEVIDGEGVIAELNGQYTNSTNGDEAENFEIASGSGILNKYANAYCARRKTGLSSAGEPTFSTKHTGIYNANDYINFDETFSKDSKPTKKPEKVFDFLEESESFSESTASNFNSIIWWTGNLKNIDNKNGKLIPGDTNILTYAHVYSDKAPGTYYDKTEAQNSIWGVTGAYPNYYPNTFKAGKAVDELETQIASYGKQIDVTVNDSEHPGTVWIESTKTYRVGPFHMGEYGYVYSEYVKPYSGAGNEMNVPGTSIGAGLVGGIDGGRITLKDDNGTTFDLELFVDGPTIVFEDFYGNPTDKGNYTRHNINNYTVPVPENEVAYPFPGAVFYIDIPREDSKDATELSAITFDYRETRTEGTGTVTIARYAKTTWTATGTKGTPSSCSYTSDHGDTRSSGSNNQETCTYNCSSDDCEDCPHEHDTWFHCPHGHTNCKYTEWERDLDVGYGQPLLIVESAKVIVETTPYTIPVNMRLTTKISIKKYAKEIKHATNGEITFGDNVTTTVLTTSQTPTARKAMADSQKQSDPVYAEYGDIIKYRIDIKNDQKYQVKVQLKDILPDKVKLVKRDFKNYEWLTIPGEKEVELELILITEANDDNLYVNEVKLVTKNVSLKKDDDENVDFIRTTDSRQGPVVNLIEIDKPSDIISKEYHRINDYDLDIDKYITNYYHEMMDENNRNTITNESYDVEALKNNGRLDQTIERKKNYPVPVEKTEKFVYSIRMTNNSVKTGTNKVATKVRPTEIIDTLDEALKYVSIEGHIYDSSGKVKYTLVDGTDFTIKEDGTTKNKFYINLNNMQGNDYLVIEPDEYLIYEMTVEVIESNMRLEIIENLVNISILSNINNGTTIENISKAVGFTVTNPICETCGGSKQEIYYEKCTKCNGNGVVSNNGTCNGCGGTGKVKVPSKCKKCGGTGLVETNCNHVGADRFYTCKKCKHVFAKQYNASAPTVCKYMVTKKECGSTSFTEKCTVCNKTKGNCTHYVYYCSGTSTHSHTKTEVGRGKNSPSVCRYKFTCDKYHQDAGVTTVYMASDGCNSSSAGTCPHGYTYGPNTTCNYCGTKLADNATSCPRYEDTYKCSKGCTSNSSGKCSAHNETMTFSKRKCMSCKTEYTSQKACDKKVRCTKTSFTKKCFAGGSEHNVSDCNHFKFVCDSCGKSYDSKPSKCDKKIVERCNGTDFEMTCMDCNGTGKKKAPCTDCANSGGTGTGETYTQIACPTCSGAGTSTSTNLCWDQKPENDCYSTGHIHKTRTCTDCSGTGKDGNFESDRIVRKADGSINRNLARNKNDDGDGTNEQSSEYVRMKDLVISGYVWLDMNRDGLMNEEDGKFLVDEEGKDLPEKAYYNIGNNTKEAGKQSVVVNLYSVIGGTETLVRTTKTDNRGRYTFSNYYDGSSLQWYNDYKASCWEDYNDKNIAKVENVDKRPYERLCNESTAQTPQRIDKATNKDQYGNYKADSEFIKYYIEFEYDGVVYKSTEFYSGMDNLITQENSNDYGKIEGVDKDYKKDSNAAEFIDVREGFNQKYEYISYDIAYNTNKTEEANSRLDFDKTDHTSQLMENPNRIVTARSFINAKTQKGIEQYGKKQEDPCNRSLGNTFTLWLFNHDDYTPPKGSNHETPDTEYLKYINLGLELREDVDITLTKDVYSVRTLINGEEMEYFFNQNNTFNGETGENGSGLYLNDFIIKTPYGLDLYESDYKMRVDQYSSSAVKAYKGLNGESELNTEVTYRITVANKAINDDESITDNEEDRKSTTDTKLKVKVSEILDLYDENFKEAIVDSEGKTETKPVKVKKNGYLENGEIPYAEAWYFKAVTADMDVQDEELYVIGDGEFSSNYDKTVNDKKELIKKPVFVKADSTDIGSSATKYVKVDLTLSNESSLGKPNSNKENGNDFKADGYYTLYITGMEGLELSEGENFDIYVKYLLDDSKTEKSDTIVENADYEDTKKDIAETEDGKFIEITINESSRSAKLMRSLKILDKIQKTKGIAKNSGVIDLDTARGLEGIAQVNLYSVWYEPAKEGEESKPASLVDMDANAGNIGNVNNGLEEKLKGETDTQTRLEILKSAKDAKSAKDSDNKFINQTSADNWNLYEDITYKTGIEITADGSEWTKGEAKDLHAKIDIQEDKMIRTLTGKVWDDTRSDSLGGTDTDTQYLGNGKYSKTDAKQGNALANKNVPENYDNKQAIEGKNDVTPNEEQDIKVRNVKAELIEIVEIPEENGKSRFYEEVLGNVTWEQAQHIRTKSDGTYTLTGFIPGKYIVRFTYGDTIKETDLTNAEKNFATETIKYVTEDMQVFNGQDYKTTKYAYDLSSDYNKNDEKTGLTVSAEGERQVADIPSAAKETNGKTHTIDEYAAGIVSDNDELSKNDVVMLALERPDLSDARDDEIRRLEVNDYSEIMINHKAEVLKGLANNTVLSTQQLGGEIDKVTGKITKKGDVSVNYYENYGKEEYQEYMEKNLKELTDNTNMNAETVEFLVKPEKLTYEQTNERTYYTKLKASSKDYYYNDLDTIVHEIITSREYKIENIDMGIEYRPETNISLTKEIDQILLVTSDNEILANLKLYTETKMENGVEKVTHHVDMSNSTGADKVQFISNTYEVDKLLEGIVNIHEERQQGFIYVQVDEELLQGCKVIVQYKFTAQNNSEVDKVSNKLKAIRFYGNTATQELADNANYKNGVLSPVYDDATKENKQVVGSEYRANNFAKNMTYADVYSEDTTEDKSIYRNRPKTMVQDSVNGSRGSDGYFGDYVGYTYYIGDDKHNLDTIAEMKFDRIIDYVDTDLEYVQLTDDEGRLLDTDGKNIMSNPETDVSKTTQSAQSTKLMSSTGLDSVIQNDSSTITDSTENSATDIKTEDNNDKSTSPAEESTEAEDNAGTSSTGNNTSGGFTSVVDGSSDMSIKTNKYWVPVSPKAANGGQTSTEPGTPSLPSTILGQESLILNWMRQSIFRLGAPWAKETYEKMNIVNKSDNTASGEEINISKQISGTEMLDILVDMRGIQYKSLVMTVADRESDNQEHNSNSDFSKFLLPRVVAEKETDFKQNDEKSDKSKAIIYLPVSKVLASEEDTENMLYENIAEVIQFTVLTGRRTNFDTTIGNADIHVMHEQNPKKLATDTIYPYEKYGSAEFATAALEKDTSSTETITLTPPTGLMQNRRAIFEAMETTRDVLKVTVIAVAVVVIAIVVTKFTMLKIKKRRYK